MRSPIEMSTILGNIKRRNRLRFVSSALVLLAHAGFVGGIMFYRDWFASPIGDGALTVGIVATIATILFFILMELIYILLIPKLDDIDQVSDKQAITKEGQSNG